LDNTNRVLTPYYSNSNYGQHSSRNGRPESFNFAEKKEEMLDPAEIPLRLEQALSYLSSNNQICEHFAVPDCECFLFNTRDANYEQDQH
jgi:hypothetical protein